MGCHGINHHTRAWVAIASLTIQRHGLPWHQSQDKRMGCHDHAGAWFAMTSTTTLPHGRAIQLGWELHGEVGTERAITLVKRIPLKACRRGRKQKRDKDLLNQCEV
eukprot:scpid92175/ scgid25449/ 